MQITAAEFTTNIGKYLEMANTRDIYITRNGSCIAKLTSPAPDRVAMLDSLVGIAGQNGPSLSEIRDERLGKA